MTCTLQNAEIPKQKRIKLKIHGNRIIQSMSGKDFQRILPLRFAKQLTFSVCKSSLKFRASIFRFHSVKHDIMILNSASTNHHTIKLAYSGTPLIRPPTGHRNLAVLTGWPYKRGRVKFHD